MRSLIQQLFVLSICACSLTAITQPLLAEESSSEMFPDDQLYPAYRANPLSVTFSFQKLFYDKSTIADTSLSRYDLKLGGRLGIYRKSQAQRSWQLTLVGGFHGQFDRNYSEDNIGWDGIYGISYDVLENEQLAWRLGVHHISSHIGDEIIERTGRTRVNYTRQELRAGVMWLHSPRWQSYGELGWAYDFNNKLLQKRLRAELGMQYENPDSIFEDFGMYTALDLSSYEESDWDINTTFQIGFITKSDQRRWRFGFEFYNGRSALGEFFQDKESYMGIGLWIDI